MKQTLSQSLSTTLGRLEPITRNLPLCSIRGSLIESRIPKDWGDHQLGVGTICRILTRGALTIKAEVIAIHEDRISLMPLDPAHSLSLQDRLTLPERQNNLPVPVGQALLGRVIDSLGRPLDELGPIKKEASRSFFQSSPHVLKRKPIDQIFPTGIRPIDTLLTVGIGQRMGIFSGPGVGKSTLLSMIAKESQSDVAVIALIGERGREVQEFIHHSLGPLGLKKTVVVVSSPDDPPLRRVRAAYTATVMGEYFRDQGRSVVLMVDSLTRLAHAQREIALMRGEPPAGRGYPPSVFSMLGELLERAGTGTHGSLTAFYNILVEGDDLEEPVSDSLRGILDGHIVLSRKLSASGHFPAIDIPQSLSRLMNSIATNEHIQAATTLRSWIARYYEMENLIQVGAYVKGNDRILDEAIAKHEQWKKFLLQSHLEHADFPTSLKDLLVLTKKS